MMTAQDTALIAEFKKLTPYFDEAAGRAYMGMWKHLESAKKVGGSAYTSALMAQVQRFESTQRAYERAVSLCQQMSPAAQREAGCGHHDFVETAAFFPQERAKFDRFDPNWRQYAQGGTHQASSEGNTGLLLLGVAAIALIAMTGSR